MPRPHFVFEKKRPIHRAHGVAHRHNVAPTGRTIFYATHIFDHLAEWATHVLYFAQGKIECCCPLAEARHK